MTTSPEPKTTGVTTGVTAGEKVAPPPDFDKLNDDELRKYVYRNQKKLPSSPMFGGIMLLGGLGSMALILLTYTLLDIQWQQDLGPWWNYGVVIGLIPFTSVLMKLWQPDETL